MYTIPKYERKFMNLTEVDRKQGIMKMRESYRSCRDKNGKMLIVEPELNKYLEFISHLHKGVTMPQDLTPLQSKVKEFFSRIYENVDGKERKNLFTHLVMRECNKKDIPISSNAICKAYKVIFQEDLGFEYPRRVSNFCGLYLTSKPPSVFLADKDTFDEIFIPKQNTPPTDMEICHYLIPKELVRHNNPMSGRKLKQVILVLLEMNPKAEKVSTVQHLVDNFCRVYSVEEDLWGKVNNTNRTYLRKQFSEALKNLRKDKLMKKASHTVALVTAKGRQSVNRIIARYEKLNLINTDTPETLSIENVNEVSVEPNLTTNEENPVMDELTKITESEPENTTNLLTIFPTEENSNTEDYDSLLRDTLKENDDLKERAIKLNNTIEGLLNFLRGKELLTDYIISVSNTENTEIPF